MLLGPSTGYALRTVSAPTKIYLALVTVLLGVWIAMSSFVSASHGTPSLLEDWNYRLDHSDELTAVLRGRIALNDAAGAPLETPEGTLVVEVRSTREDGTPLRPRIAEVQPDGLFEITSLPHGKAVVSVLLGGGEVVERLEGVVIGAEGVLDPRIDPIDLGDRLFPFTLHVAGPTGEPVEAGRLAWRASSGPGDDLKFAGLAPIHDGRATFLTTSPLVDAVCLVPGAQAELFEGLYADDSIDLGPGTTVRVAATGTLPDPEQWSLRVVLVPEDLRPRIEIDSRGLDASTGAHIAEVDPSTGVAWIPVPRAGTYRLRWWAVQPDRHRFETLKLDADGEDAKIDVPLGGGVFEVERAFPIEAFVRKTPARRR